MKTKTVRIGIFGCGTVGSSLVELINMQKGAVSLRAGVNLEIKKIGVKSLNKKRPSHIKKSLLTSDLESLENLDIVVELMGGKSQALSLIKRAINAGKPVVTANKEVMAENGASLHNLAAAKNSKIFHEAAVAGGIPLVGPLSSSLLGEPISRITGIINGTTNYILSSMSEQGVSYQEALADAQKLGYAEKDPSADVKGMDAAAKIAILAKIIFGQDVKPSDVYCEGITKIAQGDIMHARSMDKSIKLLAIAERAGLGGALKAGKTPERGGVDKNKVAIRVHPALISNDHPLAKVGGNFNAVFVDGDFSGQLMFYGQGAGGDPTASAVFGDVISAALYLKDLHLKDGYLKDANLSGLTRQKSPEKTLDKNQANIADIEELESAYYLRLQVSDRPGVLAQVSRVFGDNKVSVQSMEQNITESAGIKNTSSKNTSSKNMANKKANKNISVQNMSIKNNPSAAHKGIATLVFITYLTEEAKLRKTLKGLEKLDCVRQVASVLRVFE